MHDVQEIEKGVLIELEAKESFNNTTPASDICFKKENEGQLLGFPNTRKRDCKYKYDFEHETRA